MAQECFCGCGRQVRGKFGMKRKMSELGQQVDGIVLDLKTYSRGLVPDGTAERKKLESLIDHGGQFRDRFAAIVHGDMKPAAIDSKHFAEWMHAARGISEAHKRRVAQASDKTARPEAG